MDIKIDPSQKTFTECLGIPRTIDEIHADIEPIAREVFETMLGATKKPLTKLEVAVKIADKFTDTEILYLAVEGLNAKVTAGIKEMMADFESGKLTKEEIEKA